MLRIFSADSRSVSPPKNLPWGYLCHECIQIQKQRLCLFAVIYIFSGVKLCFGDISGVPERLQEDTLLMAERKVNKVPECNCIENDLHGFPCFFLRKIRVIKLKKFTCVASLEGVIL